MQLPRVASQGAPTAFVQSRVIISAPLETVWQRTIDISRWPDRCPTLQRVRVEGVGRLSVGTRSSLQQPLQPQRDWKITELVPRQVAAWRTVVGASAFEAGHKLMKCSTLVESILQLHFVPTWQPLQHSRTLAFKAALTRENNALKRMCERRRPPSADTRQTNRKPTMLAADGALKEAIEGMASASAQVSRSALCGHP